MAPPGNSSLQVVLPKHLGDLVLALPALRQLVEGLPDWTVVPVAPTWLHPVLEGQGSWIPAKSRLERDSGGASVLFSPSFRVALQAWWARIPCRIGLPTDHRAWLVDGGPWPAGELRAEGLPSLLPREHQCQSYLRVAQRAVELLGGEAQPLRIDRRFRSSREAQETAHSWWTGAGRPQVLIHPWAQGLATKRWSADRWVALARLLRGRGVSVAATGGRDDQDAQAAQCIAEAAGIPCAAGSSALSFPVWAALARQVAAVVTPDTGLMHLAVAAGARGLALFGPSDPRRHGPVGGSAAIQVVQPEPLPHCSPCYQDQCSLPGQQTCLESLRPEELAERLLPLVQAAA